MRRLLTSSDGFSMLEVLFSVGLFSVIAALMTSSFITLQKRNRENELRTGAISAAQQVLDIIRSPNTDPATLPTSGSVVQPIVTIGGPPYEVTLQYCPAGTFCSSSTMRHIRATVRFRNQVKYVVDTVFCQLR
jgi:type II secretory pathway pseudopilin PulG